MSQRTAASKVTSDQQAALLEVIAHYPGLANDVDARSRRTEITANLAETYFAWFDHIHGIYRDPTNDYDVKYA